MKTGKKGIDSKASFVDALAGQAVLNIPNFSDIFQKAENLIRSEYSDVSREALSNVRGSWYEWLIALGYIEYNSNEKTSKYLIQLPNISQYDCAKLYIDRIFQYIIDLRSKVSQSSGVSLITSNPDFVIIDRNVPIDIPKITSGSVSIDDITQLGSLYLQAEHLCLLDQITGYVAVKSSLRPDRRLQIAHEGSLMKAIYKHVQTREWIIDAPGIQYYAMSIVASEPDYKALKTVATHSITDVGSKPQAAVDDLFCVAGGAELKQVLANILH